MKYTWKKATAGLLAAVITSGAAFAAPAASLLPVTAITANAETTVAVNLDKWSLTLCDDLALKFYSDGINDVNQNQYKVVFTGAAANTKSSFTKTADGKFYATAHIYPKNMNQTVTAQLYKGSEPVGEPMNVSVRKYLMQVLTPLINKATQSGQPFDISLLTPAEKKDFKLINALMRFGNMSDYYFAVSDSVTDPSVAHAEYEYYFGVTEADLKAEAAKYPFDCQSAKISLALDSKMAVRVYAKDDEPGSVAGAQEKESSQEKADAGYSKFYEITGLLPQQFDTSYTYTCGGKDYTFSVLSWCNRVLSNEDSSDNNKYMAEAIVAYYLAAKEYLTMNFEEKTVDLSDLTEKYEAQNGNTLTGVLPEGVEITIAAGATVVLSDVTINNAGITTLGDATIVLQGENKITGEKNAPGIRAVENQTLTIKGSGSLAVSGGEGAAGIGGGSFSRAGDIVIQEGTITAHGGKNAPGIGSGVNGSCGNIVVEDTITELNAVKGASSEYSIGAGKGGSCGMVTIGTKITDGITESPYSYKPKTVKPIQ